MTIRSITDPERFRVQYRGGRRYVDREPADGTWEPTGEKDKLINCTTVAKAISSDAFFKKVGSSRVPLDALRVAKYVDENLDRPTSPPRRTTDVPAAMRAQVLDRALGVCEAHTRDCTYRVAHVHHRAGRGVGRNHPDLLLAVCSPCHRYIHDHPTESYEHGWMVKRNTLERTRP